MKIFYLCPTGLHTALVAAGLHVGWLQADRPPVRKDLHKMIKEYRRLDYKLGKPVSIGIDRAGNEVFTVGVGRVHEIMKKVVTDVFKKVYGVSEEEYLVVDTAGLANGWINTGSFFSMRIKMSVFGETLCAYGIRKYYPDIINIVEQVKSETFQSQIDMKIIPSRNNV